MYEIIWHGRYGQSVVAAFPALSEAVNLQRVSVSRQSQNILKQKFKQGSINE
jgi:hypothetical protein